jgi:hypothetical protein
MSCDGSKGVVELFNGVDGLGDFGYSDWAARCLPQNLLVMV